MFTRGVLSVMPRMRCCRLATGMPIHNTTVKMKIMVAGMPQVLVDARRYKYTQHTGVKGIRGKRNSRELEHEVRADDGEDGDAADELNLIDQDYDEIAQSAMHVSRNAHANVQSVLVIQPYVKWGPKRNAQTDPDDQLAEAVALVHSLPNWQVAHALKVPLESLERKSLFGVGKLAELKQLVQELRSTQPTTTPSATCLFISKGTLTFVQKRTLEMEFQLPVMDRYSVVIQILRLHATMAEAKLQVAMAEIPYIWAQAKDANLSMARKQGYSLNDMQRDMLKQRERRLKTELERIRQHRQLLRNKRKQKNYPVVAVVGYTNCGKTSLIKALTAEASMQPRNQLFATLDVTAHMGVLPCNLEVLYMDTVGFMSDLPTGLIECFVATLEDAMLADLIIHVQDLSHTCHTTQRQHVEETLTSLSRKMSSGSTNGAAQPLPPIINVGNKIDLIASNKSDDGKLLRISAKEQIGLPTLLNEVEAQLLAVTGRRKLTMRVPNGGAEMAWLHKNTAVMQMRADDGRPDQMLIDVVLTEKVLQHFKREFCQ